MTEIVPTRILAPVAPIPERQGGPVAPRVRVASVGDLAGLSPRRARGDGGEVAGAAVDTVDALDRRIEWPTVVAWLSDKRAVTTRQGYLQNLAHFVRWLAAAAPGTGILQVDRHLLDLYRDAMATGRGFDKPLGPDTVSWRLATLSSLYDFAFKADAVLSNPVVKVRRPETGGVGKTPTMTEEESAALILGAARIAKEHPADAAAVALLVVCTIRVGELLGLAVGDVRDEGNHVVLLFRRKGGRTGRVPVPPLILPLVEPLRIGRAAGEPFVCDPDGTPWKRWRTYTALRRAAGAGGIPRERADRIRPHGSRATGTTLLLDAGADLRKVQHALGHSSPNTTQDYYDRGTVALSSHVVYALASRYADAIERLQGAPDREGNA